jgi:uncharacterized protein YbaR (Trm112 family)
MVAMHDFFEVDLPGELHEPAEIIPFPGGWEPDPEPPACCALCGEAYDIDDEDQAGVCRVCADRLPKVGGCGLALWLVAGMVSGEAGPALDHLAACPDCRAFFDQLGDLARVADLEQDTAAPRAEPVKVAA